MKHLIWIIPLIVIAICAVPFIPDFQYNSEEQQVIKQLKAKTHNPSAVEIVSIKRVSITELPADALLVMASSYNPEIHSVYKIFYRSENVYGALRSNIAYGFYTSEICFIFTENGKML